MGRTGEGFYLVPCYQYHGTKYLLVLAGTRYLPQYGTTVPVPWYKYHGTVVPWYRGTKYHGTYSTVIPKAAP